MRQTFFRSVFRAALIAGVIGSGHSAKATASWKEFLQPYAGACFVHDHSWDHYGASLAIRGDVGEALRPDAPNALWSGSSETQAVADDSHAIETELCIAMAKRFEKQAQAEAAWDAFRFKSMEAQKFLTGIAGSLMKLPAIIAPVAEEQSLSVIQWLTVHVTSNGESIDSIAPVQADDSLVNICEVPPQTVEVTCQEMLVSHDESEFACQDWNCTDWNRDIKDDTSISVPFRERANIFVYSLQRETEPSCPHQWQVGVDPVCPEIHSHPVSMFGWNELADKPTICCPIDDIEYDTHASQNIAEGPVLPQRPPTLDADFDTSSESMASVQDQDSQTQVATDFDWELKSHVLPWQSWVGERLSPFCTLGLSKPALEIEGYSAESLAGLNDRMMEPMIDMAVSSDGAQSSIDSFPATEPFQPHDFLTYRLESPEASIILPIKASHQVAVDFAMNHLWKAAADSSLWASKNLAYQIRTVGQFLVDFARNLENRANQVEIARQDSHQR